MMNKIVTISILFFLAFINTSIAQTASDASKKDNTPIIKNMTVKEFLQLTTTNEKLVVVYFHADWCVPCIKLNPVINQIELEEKESILLLKIDVDENPLISKYLEINTLPLFTIYKKGKAVWTQNSSLTKQELQHQIDSNK